MKTQNLLQINTDLGDLRSGRDIEIELERVRVAQDQLKAYSELLRALQEPYEANDARVGEAGRNSVGDTAASSKEIDDVKLTPRQSIRSATLAILKAAHGPISIQEIWRILHAAGFESNYEKPVQQISATLASLKSSGHPVDHVGERSGVWKYLG